MNRLQLKDIAKNRLKSSLTSAIEDLEEQREKYTETEFDYLINKLNEYSIYLRKTIDLLM